VGFIQTFSGCWIFPSAIGNRCGTCMSQNTPSIGIVHISDYPLASFTDTDETMRRWDEKPTSTDFASVTESLDGELVHAGRMLAAGKEREPDDEYKEGYPLFNQLLVFMMRIRNWPADELHVLPWRILVRHLPFRLNWVLASRYYNTRWFSTCAVMCGVLFCFWIVYPLSSS